MLSNLKRMLAFKILKRPPQLASFRNCSGASKTAAPETVEKVEEKLTLVQKWKKYWKTVYSDYRDVALDVAKDIREKPVKSVFLFSLAGLLYYVVHNKPSERDFRDFFLRCNNQVLLVHPNLQRKQTVSHLRTVESCYNQNLIRSLNLGVVTVIWADYYSDGCNSGESSCSYLQLRYRDFVDRVLDVGALNYWFVLNEKMVDYDVNY